MFNFEETKLKAQKRRELTERIKKIIVERLHIDIDPELITDDQPLFGRGLGLDSIDALELCLAVEDEFDVEIYDDNLGVFGSVNKLADFILSGGVTSE